LCPFAGTFPKKVQKFLKQIFVLLYLFYLFLPNGVVYVALIRIVEVASSHLDPEAWYPETLSVVFLLPPGNCWIVGVH
jgi:hypothetical protein